MGYEFKDEIVIKPKIAKALLKKGYRIKNLFPQDQNDGSTDYTRCVFLFQGDYGLNRDLMEFLDKDKDAN